VKRTISSFELAESFGLYVLDINKVIGSVMHCAISLKLQRKAEIGSLFFRWGTRKDAENFRDGLARVWKSRTKIAQPMQKKIYRDLLGNLGPVT